MKVWASPVGELELNRWPVRVDDPLQAWDGADTYLVQEALERLEGLGPGPVLGVGDGFGALATALATTGREVVSWGDGEVSRLALEVNAPGVAWLPITEAPPVPSLVVGRIPKSVRRLKWTLGRLAEVLAPGTSVLLGAKSKLVQKSHVAAAEATIGPARSTRAAHRARLVLATRDDRAPALPDPRTWELEPGLVLQALPGVFGEDRIDGGTRLLVAHLVAGSPEAPRPLHLTDLGCGAGPLGLLAARLHPDARVTFRAASHAAVASARTAFEAVFPGEDRASFVVADAMDGAEPASVDLILCNPPFHQGNEVTRRVAAHMFAGSAWALRPDGRLLVVGNRHLGYHTGLKKTFRSVQPVRSDRRFVVLEATLPRAGGAS